jgi:murein L,D-transpeptidase YafK
MQTRLHLILILILAFFQGENNASNRSDNESTYPNQKVSLKKLIDSLNIDPVSVRVLIVKSKYELSVWSDTIELKIFPVVFGGNPVDDKLREGDRCTPEGEFKIRSKYPHKSWSKFIWLDYPNAVSWEKHNDAVKKGIIPGDSKIGGEVGIHGVPKNCDFAIDQRQNWTWGCISLKNKDVGELYEVVNSNTIIKIIK